MMDKKNREGKLKRYGKKDKEKFIYRFAWFCACGRRERGRAGKYLEVSLSCSKGWRGNVPCCLYYPCTDFWVYAFDYGDFYWQKDQAEPVNGVWYPASEMEGAWRDCLSGSDDHPAILLRYRRMGSQVSFSISDRKWHESGRGRVFYGFYFRPGTAACDDGSFLAAVAFIIFRGVDKGIESLSKVLMPVLLVFVVVIAVFSLTITHTDDGGVTRTGLEGFRIYVIPDFNGMTLERFLTVLLDAMGQLFFSLSVAMGIMITYGSYVHDDANLKSSINQIEVFDTLVAFLAGVMVIPAVYTFAGTEGMGASGPGLMFVTLPKVFRAMGTIGNFMGILFFAMVLFAALTSAVSIMEAVVSCLMDEFHLSRTKATVLETVIAGIFGLLVCFGYNVFYFELKLPNGAVAQILDIMDYVSNNLLMPLVAIGTCVLIGWVVKPKTVIEEVEKTGCKMGRKRLYIVMIKVVAPVMLAVLFLKSLGV